MKANRQGAARAHPGGFGIRAVAARWWRSLVKAQLAGLTLSATLFMLAAPVHARAADESGHRSPPRHEAGFGSADEATLPGDATSRGRLPFARPDFATLVLGALIVTMAAAGAPLLLRPLRAIPPILVAAAGQPEPLLPATAQGAAAHAQA